MESRVICGNTNPLHTKALGHIILYRNAKPSFECFVYINKKYIQSMKCEMSDTKKKYNYNLIIIFFYKYTLSILYKYLIRVNKKYLSIGICSFTKFLIILFSRILAAER